MVPPITHDWLTSTRLILGGVIALTIFLTISVGPFSLTADSTREDITFYHLSENGATVTDSLRDTMETAYPGTFTDTAQVGLYTFDVSQEYTYNEYCALDPIVKRNNVVIDEYSHTNEIQTYASNVEKDDTANKVQHYGEFTAKFATPHYMDKYVYRGTFYGITDCHGTFNRYELAVDHDAIAVDVSTTEKAVQGQPVTATVHVNNAWKPLRADLETRICIDGSFCQTLTRDDVPLPRGTSTVEFTYTPKTAGDVTATVSGPVGLDLQQYTAEGVAVDCTGDGTKQDPATCRMITIGEVTGSGVTAVKSPGTAVFDNDLLVPTLQIYWGELMQWLFGAPR